MTTTSELANKNNKLPTLMVFLSFLLCGFNHFKAPPRLPTKQVHPDTILQEHHHCILGFAPQKAIVVLMQPFPNLRMTQPNLKLKKSSWAHPNFYSQLCSTHKTKMEYFSFIFIQTIFWRYALLKMFPLGQVLGL